MSNKYFGGEVRNGGASDAVDEDLKNVALASVKKAESKMNELRVADAITEIFNIFRRCNKYIDETMPWALAKDEAQKDRLATVLYNLVEAITIGASLLESFMPDTSRKILAPVSYTHLDVYKRQFLFRGFIKYLTTNAPVAGSAKLINFDSTELKIACTVLILVIGFVLFRFTKFRCV